MAEVTVEELARVVGTPVEKLVLQFKDAGILIDSTDQVVSDKDKQALLEHLRRVNAAPTESASPKKITLKRKSTSQLKVSSGKSRGSVVNVEVRKKRTYVKRSEVIAEQEKLAQQEREKEEQQRLAREAEERAQAEILAAQEAEAQAAAEQVVQVEPLKETVAQEQIETLAEAQDDITIDESTEVAEAASGVSETEAFAENDAAVDTALAEERKEAALVKAEDLDDDDRSDKKAKRKPETKTRRQPKAKLREADIDLEDDYLGEEEVAAIAASAESGAKSRRKKSSKSDYLARVSAITKHGFAKPTAPVIKDVEIPETISVADLAQKMSLKAAEVVKALIQNGIMATMNQKIDQDTAIIVVEELGHNPKPVRASELENKLQVFEDAEDREQYPRPPVVTIMGHVDHGKTSLLDYIRRSQVTKGEAGGITQHIGAYKISNDHGGITFLDTPGHAAFTAMRARGSKCTDIVILVVAADDGVMPQTEEAIQHAKVAGAPIIVAVNKIDKPEADLDRVKNELSVKNVIPEDWGGDTQFVPVSAITGEGVDDLLEAISLQAEMLELKAPKEGAARGVIIEASLDKGRGPVATVLVQRGKLNKGDILLAGTELGRVRALLDENGMQLTEAGPSVPVEILGLSGVPNAGDEVIVVPDEKKGREIADLRKQSIRNAQGNIASTEDIFAQLQDSEKKTLNIVLKADVHGSVEALSDALEKCSRDDVNVAVIYKGVGGITESDIQLASASNALMVGFNVRADASARRAAEETDTTLYYYSVIYDVIDEIKKSVKGLVAPVLKEEILGTAEVRDVFRSSKFGAVAGCMVKEGVVKRNKPIRVLRDNVVIYEGELESLRRFKDDVNEVRNGMECGIGVKDYNDVKAGDFIENFERVEVHE